MGRNSKKAKQRNKNAAKIDEKDNSSVKEAASHDKKLLLKNALKQQWFDKKEKNTEILTDPILSDLTPLYEELLSDDMSKMPEHISKIQSFVKDLDYDSKEKAKLIVLNESVFIKLFNIFILSIFDGKPTPGKFEKFYNIKDENKFKEYNFYYSLALLYERIGDFDNAEANAEKFVERINELISRTSNSKIKDDALSQKAVALESLGLILLNSTSVMEEKFSKKRIKIEKAINCLEESYSMSQDLDTLILLCIQNINLKRFGEATRWINKVENEELKDLLRKMVIAEVQHKYVEIDPEKEIGNELENRHYKEIALNYCTKKAVVENKSYKEAIDIHLKLLDICPAERRLSIIKNIQVLCMISGDPELLKMGAKLFEDIENITVPSEALKLFQCLFNLELEDYGKAATILGSIDTNRSSEIGYYVSDLYFSLAINEENNDLRQHYLQEALRLNPENIEAARLKSLLESIGSIRESVLNEEKEPTLKYKEINDALQPAPSSEEESLPEDEHGLASYDEKFENLSEDEVKEEIPTIIEVSNEQYRLLENISNLPVSKLDELLLDGLINISTFHKYCQLAKSRAQAQIRKDAREIAAKISKDMFGGLDKDNITWDLGKYGVISTENHDAVAFEYRGTTVYAVIANHIVEKLEKAGAIIPWLNALQHGLAICQEGENGIKIFRGAAELKLVGEDLRLFTDCMIVNVTGNRLLVFDRMGPHKKVKKVACENNSLKVKVVGLGEAIREQEVEKHDLDEDICKAIYNLLASKDEEQKINFIEYLIKNSYKKEVGAFAAYKLEKIEKYQSYFESIGVLFDVNSLRPDVSDVYYSIYNEVSYHLMGE
jgi:hypothetical protein